MTLDHFEQTLLTDLRGHVAERATAPQRSPGRSPRRRWRWAAAPVAAAGVAIAVGIALVQPSAAYAVNESGEDVVVTIKRLDDAAGLERALAEHGIDAEVDYSAEPMAPPAGGETHVEHGSSSDDGPSLNGSDEQSGGAGDSGPDAGPAITSSLSEDAFTLRIDPDTIPDDLVMHITTSGSLDSGLSGLQVAFTPAD